MTTTAIDVPSGAPAAVPTPRPDDPRIARFSLNQRSLAQWGVPEVVRGCVDRGVGAVGLWREQVAECGLARSARLVGDAGLRVSSYCRGGFLTGADQASALAENRRAVEEAAELGAPCLVMVVGGLPEGSRDLSGARAAVADGIQALAPYADEHGVRIALEPLHPMFCADRAVLSTLRQALDLAERVDPEGATVGVVVDAYHVWWDPDLDEQLTRAGRGGRILSFQTCDWVLPFPEDALLARGVPGDGHVDLRRLLRRVQAEGYTGDIEVEVFNAELWAADGDQAFDTLLRRHVQHVV
ncbi:sugar phosphate isomerase/epimerase [Spiractinospora alimapuensis]|uniref:sugar phosphate isomerase/epimerase family protein n=1 Tax=Spiractinospora alimapuensis TaxID=2820884 RepID=UPI001F28F0E3|nr:sugar phosphate isomerase/epimerase [Spiractinospora alimapuensis]QVQ53358.1 sugar phosphate isomerase/epimerase [Spiractinospora alimapuensis]